MYVYGKNVAKEMQNKIENTKIYYKKLVAIC